jgi:pilus assembly protein CpaC
MIRRNLMIGAALGIMAAFAWAMPADAQEVPQKRTLPGASNPAVLGTVTMPRALPAAVSKTIRVGLNKAIVVSLPSPVSKIVVGNEEVADVHVDSSNPRQVFVVSKTVGSTNVFFMNKGGVIIHQAEVQVSMNHDELQTALSELLPNEKIDVSVYRDSVFLSGNVRSAAAAADAVRIANRFVTDAASVTNMLKIGGSQQVILQVRVAEMNRSVRKNLAVNQKISINSFLGDLDITTSSPTTSGVTPFGTGHLNHDIVGLTPAAIQALEQQSLVKTLAEPTLTALSGEAASFLSGGETPVPVGVDENGQAIIEFREYGIQLNFTPIVQSKGRINLKVSTEISSIDSTNTVTVVGSVVNGFSTKRTETTVDLPSGGSLMLSGLLQEDVTDVINGFPLLKDLPVLGALFRSTDFQNSETELVITVTAFLAKPAGNNAALALPSDGFEPSSDIDLYLFGRLHREYGEGELPFWKDLLRGPFGYIMK